MRSGIGCRAQESDITAFDMRCDGDGSIFEALQGIRDWSIQGALQLQHQTLSEKGLVTGARAAKQTLET